MLCKSCTSFKCQQINPQPLEKFSKDKSRKDGLRNTCKACSAIEHYKHYRKNTEKYADYNKEYAQTLKGRANGKKGRKRYGKTLKGKSSKEKYRKSKKGRETRKQIDVRHRQTPKGKATHAAVQANRRASKKRATPPWLTLEQHKENKLFYTEVSGLNEETYIIHHVDHIIPLQGKEVCGLHVPWNLQVLTAEENTKKNNKFDFTYDNDSWRSE